MKYSEANVGAVIRTLSAIPLPERDRQAVRKFAKTLPKDQNLPATQQQLRKARRLAAGKK